MKWQEIKLGNIAEFSNGVNFKSEQMGSGYQLINVKDIFHGQGIIDFNALDLVNLLPTPNLNKYFVKKGDIFFVRSSVKRDGVGLAGRANEDAPNTVHCGFVIRCRLKDENISPNFLTYLLRTPFCRQKIINLSSGTTITNISQKSLGDLSIQVPDLKTQNKIADILSRYDEAIANNRRRIELLERSSRLLYREWFVHLRYPGHEHGAIGSDGIPEGWKRKKLEEIADITMGQSPKSEFYNETGEGLPFHQGVSNFGFRFPVNSTYSTKGNRIGEAGDILFSVRAPVGRINLNLEKIILGRGLAGIRSKLNCQNFLFYQLKNHFFKEDMMGGGAIFAAITKKDLHSVELIKPFDTLIQLFSDQVIPMDEQVKNLYLQNQKLQSARDLLLPRLMNGEINV